MVTSLYSCVNSYGSYNNSLTTCDISPLLYGVILAGMQYAFMQYAKNDSDFFSVPLVAWTTLSGLPQRDQAPPLPPQLPPQQPPQPPPQQPQTTTSPPPPSPIIREPGDFYYA